MSLILGLNAYHGDAAACLLRDGKIVAAVEEERFRRIKHWAGFPSQAIAYCLSAAGAKVTDLDFVAINRDPKAARWRKVAFLVQQRPSPALVLARLKNRHRWQTVEQELARAFPSDAFRGRVVNIEHHRCHLASAFFASPFERAAVVSLDGMGDFASAAWGVGEGNSLKLEGRVYSPHSLGIFYMAATQFLGFGAYGDEYKVMGLAPYGRPTLVEKLRQIVLLQHDGRFTLDLDYFRHQRENVPYEWEGGSPKIGQLFSPAWEALLGPARAKDGELTQHHRDLAFATQAVFEEATFNLLRPLQQRSGATDLAIAGGCGFNSVANGKVRRQTAFRRVYVQAAAGDAGGAVGAALALWHEQAPSARRQPVLTAALGPSFDDAAIAAVITEAEKEWRAEGCEHRLLPNDQTLVKQVAQAITTGAVVGWFQGRLEWGPRALGQRSILCDPRRADMKELLNLKIKRRESFRPFAPSILREAVADWFEEEDEVPFMMQVFQVRADKRALVPAVVHVDGSGRLQSVSAAAQPLYHDLIKCFGELTGVPLLLNTSFNENEPIVCRPEEALACFLRTKMDLLAMGRHILIRKGTSCI